MVKNCLLILTLTNLRKHWVLAIGLGVLLPLGDAGIVLFHENADLIKALVHLVGVVMMVGV